VGYLPKVWLPPQEVRDLREIVRYRQQLAEQRRAAKLRIRAILRSHRLTGAGQPWTKAWIAWLRDEAPLVGNTRWVMDQHLANLERLAAEIKRVEKRLEEVTKDDKIVQKLLEEPGIGLITAVTMRAEIGRFDRFRTGKQLCRFAGTCPRNASSGNRQADAGLVKACNPELRRVLMEVAQRLINREEEWAGFAQRMRERGKPRSLVAAAVANRWLRRLYHEMKTLAA
jgi:transposase